MDIGLNSIYIFTSISHIILTLFICDDSDDIRIPPSIFTVNPGHSENIIAERCESICIKC